MAKKIRDDDAAKVTRFQLLCILLFAWCSLTDLDEVGFDKRRRTTDLLHTFAKYARKILLVNALSLARAYASLALDATHSTLEFPGHGLVFPSTSWASLGWSWFQAVSTTGILLAMLIKISSVTSADHAGER